VETSLRRLQIVGSGARAVVECSHRPFDHGAFNAPLDGLMMQSERPTHEDLEK
jgi:hypothetical protein